MRRGSSATFTPPTRPPVGFGSTPFVGPNLEMWILLENESRNTNALLLETVQQLKTEIVNLRADNGCLMREQEQIMKSLTDKQNHRNSIPSLDNGNRAESYRRMENSIPKGSQTQESEGDQKTNKKESGNVSGGNMKKGAKRRKMESQENSKR